MFNNSILCVKGKVIQHLVRTEENKWYDCTWCPPLVRNGAGVQAFNKERWEKKHNTGE